MQLIQQSGAEGDLSDWSEDSGEEEAPTPSLVRILAGRLRLICKPAGEIPETLSPPNFSSSFKTNFHHGAITEPAMTIYIARCEDVPGILVDAAPVSSNYLCCALMP